MPSYVNFFDSAVHKLQKLRKREPFSPRKAALLLALWSLERSVLGHVTGDYQEVESEDDDGILHAAACVRGGIGDNILSLAFLHAFADYAGCPVLFDIYTTVEESVIRSLCHGQRGISHIHSIKVPFRKKYDLVADITRMVWFPQMNSQKIRHLSEQVWTFIKSSNAFRQGTLVSFYSEGQRIGIDYADIRGSRRPSQMDMSDVLQLEKREFLLQCEEPVEAVCARFGISGPFITLHRESGNAESSSLKLWPEENYRALTEALRNTCTEATLVFLGSEKDCEMPGCLDLRGRTSFPELKALVKGAALHVGGEGLIPHLRHFLHGGPSVVLFGPTSGRHYGYPENINIQGKECPEGCEWITQTWQSKCVKGYDYCRCMAGISVDMVMREISGQKMAQSRCCVSGEGQ